MTNVLVINQHGDNRGDEAALRAMAEGLDERLADLRMTVFHQFSDPTSQVELAAPTTYFPIIQPVTEALRFAVAATLSSFGLPAERLATARGRAKIEAYRTADLVVSAPGGPYFGDLYADHEIVHWFYVWLARRFGKRTMLYSPSCGPFENRVLNPIRRRGFRWFDRVAVRESQSAEHLRATFGIDPEITADSALQSRREPGSPPVQCEDDERLVAVSVRAPSDDRRDQHDRAVIEALRHLSAAQRTRFVMLPQLHGPRHADRSYLEELIDRADLGANAVVLDETLDANAHRDTIAAADLVIAGRYHPLIFSIAAAVPVMVIPYEHKAEGAASAAGIAHRILRLDELDEDSIIDALDRLVAGAAEDRRVLADRRGALVEASSQSSVLAAALASEEPPR